MLLHLVQAVPAGMTWLFVHVAPLGTTWQR